MSYGDFASMLSPVLDYLARRRRERLKIQSLLLHGLMDTLKFCLLDNISDARKAADLVNYYHIHLSNGHGSPITILNISVEPSRDGVEIPIKMIPDPHNFVLGSGSTFTFRLLSNPILRKCEVWRSRGIYFYCRIVVKYEIHGEYKIHVAKTRRFWSDNFATLTSLAQQGFREYVVRSLIRGLIDSGKSPSAVIDQLKAMGVSEQEAQAQLFIYSSWFKEELPEEHRNFQLVQELIMMETARYVSAMIEIRDRITKGRPMADYLRKLFPDATSIEIENLESIFRQQFLRSTR